MVKAQENYKAHIIGKWSYHYIQYDFLKHCIESMFEDKKKTGVTKMINKIITVAESPFVHHHLHRVANNHSDGGGDGVSGETFAVAIEEEGEESPRSEDAGTAVGSSPRSEVSPRCVDAPFLPVDDPFALDGHIGHSGSNGIIGGDFAKDRAAAAEFLEAPDVTPPQSPPTSPAGGLGSARKAMNIERKASGQLDGLHKSAGARRPIWQLRHSDSQGSYNRMRANSTATALLPGEDAPIPTGTSYEELMNSVSPMWAQATNKIGTTIKAIETTIKIKGRGVLEAPESKFIRVFKSEIGRVSAFYTEQLVEIDHLILSLVSDIRTGGVVPSKERNEKLSKAVRKAKKDRELSIVRAHELLYKKMEELEAFATLNIVLCIKILKKHDKFVNSQDPSTYLYPRLMLEVVYPSSIGGVVPPSRWRDRTDTDYSKFGGMPPKSISTQHHLPEDHSTVFLRLKKRLVDSFAEFSCDGDAVEAHGKLMMTKGDEGEVRKFLLWLALGANAVFIIWFLWDAIMDPGEGMTFWNDPAIYFYSFIGNVIIFEWTWATNVLIWERVAHINYLMLLGLTLQHSPSPEWIYFKSSVGTIIFFVNLLLYYKARRNDLYGYVDPSFFPFTLAIVAFAYVATQIVRQRHYASHRLYSPSVIFRIITAPFSPVTLRESYMADVMTSFVKVLSNFAYGMCYLAFTPNPYFVKSERWHNTNRDPEKEANYTIHDFGTCQDEYMSVFTGMLALAPLWFRFAQCLRRIYDSTPPLPAGEVRKMDFKTIMNWPHSYNALKYFLGMLVVMFGWFHPLSEEAESAGLVFYKVMFIMLVTATTAYQFYWDIWNDWGLMQILPSWYEIRHFKFKPNLFLRKRLLYKRVWVYYIAIFLNLILRGLWVLSLVPQHVKGPFQYSLNDQLGPFLATFELCRRCMWGCFKLELDHVNAGNSNPMQDSVVALHISTPKPAMEDPNRDIHVAVYHALIGLGLLAILFTFLVTL